VGIARGAHGGPAGGGAWNGAADGNERLRGRASAGTDRADAPAPDAELLRGLLSSEARSLEAVRRDLEAAGYEGGDVEPVIRALEALAAQADALDPAQLARQRAALVAALQEAEWALRAALDSDTPGLLAHREPQVAPERREAVAEYYRRLSEEPAPTR